EKAFAAECCAQVGVQHLDGDVSLVLEIVREVDGGHAARADLALQPVAISERCVETRLIRHALVCLNPCNARIAATLPVAPTRKSPVMKKGPIAAAPMASVIPFPRIWMKGIPAPIKPPRNMMTSPHRVPPSTSVP